MVETYEMLAFACDIKHPVTRMRYHREDALAKRISIILKLKVVDKIVVNRLKKE